MTTIAKHDLSIEPTLVMGYRANSEVAPIVHRIIGADDPELTLTPAGPRTGTLQLLFSSKQAALDAFALHRTPGPQSMTDADHPELSMSYVVDGQLTLELDPATLTCWTLGVPFLEVAQ